MRGVNLVLVPIDFSPGSEAAAIYAAWLASRLGARVTLFHAFAGLGRAAAGVAPGVGDDVRAAEHELREQAQRDLAAAAERLRGTAQGVAVETRLAEGGGAAADAIVRAARDLDADLIVMGTHGRTGLRRMVLGSVAEQVVRSAECPVVTVHEAWGQSAGRAGPGRA